MHTHIKRFNLLLKLNNHGTNKFESLGTLGAFYRMDIDRDSPYKIFHIPIWIVTGKQIYLFHDYSVLVIS